MRSRRLNSTTAAFFAVALASCSGEEDDGPKLLTSREDLCAGAAPVYDDHGERVATAIACPFVQQTENIAKYGDRLPAASALYDADGALVANVTHSCAAWTLGTDNEGIVIVIDRERGRVISHGTLHTGQEVTAVHSPIDLPARVRLRDGR